MLLMFGFMLSSAAYTVAAVAMKYSNGFKVFSPALAGFILFNVGAFIQTWLLAKEQLSRGYIYILGLEAILSTGLGLFIFDEPLSALKTFGIGLVISGIALIN